jgi:hypothetical protein
MTNDVNRSYHDHEHAPPGPHILPAPLISKEVYVGDKSKLMPLYTDRLARSIFMQRQPTNNSAPPSASGSPPGVNDLQGPSPMIAVGWPT